MLEPQRDITSRAGRIAYSVVILTIADEFLEEPTEKIRLIQYIG
jgi:hypothetical protein